MGFFSLFRSKSAEDVYTSIAQNIVVSALLYSTELGEENNKRSADAGAEIIYLLIHILDRAAFSCLGPEKRNTVFDSVAEIALNDYVRAVLSNAPMEFQADVKTQMFEDLEARQFIYGNCSSLAGEFPSKGTMTFALSHYVHKALELTERDDVDGVLTGDQDVTDENIDAFPDFSKILENTIWVANIIKDINFEKELKNLK